MDEPKKKSNWARIRIEIMGGPRGSFQSGRVGPPAPLGFLVRVDQSHRLDGWTLPEFDVAPFAYIAAFVVIEYYFRVRTYCTSLRPTGKNITFVLIPIYTTARR